MPEFLPIVFLNGFTLFAGLIVAIGAQNTFCVNVSKANMFSQLQASASYVTPL
jgi:hypothetical protein